MRPAAAALEEVAGALVALVGAVRVAEVVARELVALALTLVVELPAGAEVLESVASVEVLARVNAIELGAVAVPVGVIPAIEKKKRINIRKIEESNSKRTSRALRGLQSKSGGNVISSAVGGQAGGRIGNELRRRANTRSIGA